MIGAKTKYRSCGLVAFAARQKTKPWSLAPSPHPPKALFPRTLPVLAVGPRRNRKSIIKSRISTVQITGETVPEWQTHTAANSSDNDGDIRARQLWSVSRHHSKENKATNTPVTSPSPPHLIPTFHGWSQQRHPQVLRQYSSASGSRGSSRISGAQNPISHHILPRGWCPETDAAWSQRRCLFPREYSTRRSQNRVGVNKML